MPGTTTNAPTTVEAPKTLAFRRAAGAIALAGSSLGFAALSMGHTHFRGESLEWTGMAALTGVASVALFGRRLLSQIFARGVAWLVLLPSATVVVGSLLSGRWPEGRETWFAATAAGALLLARSQLHTREAKREFDPVAYRRMFLAGAVASMTASLVAATYMVAMWHYGPRSGAVGLAVLATSLVASAVGVVRMRGWGVLLGALTAAGSLVAAVTAGDEVTAVALALAALPPALLAAPVLLARLRPPEPERRASPGRVAATTEAGWLEAPARSEAGSGALLARDPPVRARVAADVEAEAEDPGAGRNLSTHAG
jgi:hypothetical protein